MIIISVKNSTEEYFPHDYIGRCYKFLTFNSDKPKKVYFTDGWYCDQAPVEHRDYDTKDAWFDSDTAKKWIEEGKWIVVRVNGDLIGDRYRFQ